MPEPITERRPAHPREGFTTFRVRACPERPARVFVPSDYQAKYAYPLVVLFHPNGTDEDAAVRLVPRFSRRNYIAVCPRGPVALGSDSVGRPRFAWGNGHPDAYLRQLLAHTRSEYHIHDRRIYCVGVGDGTTAAYRFALSAANAAGVVALNGELPTRAKAKPGLRVFIGSGTNHSQRPAMDARVTARKFVASGADVRFQTYPITSQLHDDMFRDVNRWIVTAVNTTPDLFPTGNS